MDGGAILVAEKLSRHYGGVVAVDKFSLTVPRGTALGLIGPNGAGKTTVFNLLSGFETPDEGTIWLDGAFIQGRRPHKVCRLGVGRTFQTVRVFHELTVRENLHVANLFANVSSGRSIEDRVRGHLSFVEMEQYIDTLGSDLSYGQQKLVELAMVLMGEPKLILLDEPVAGVNPVLIAKIGEMMRALVERGVTLLIVEHNVPFVAGVCDHIMVMANGRLLAEGTGAEIQKDEQVLEAFLGGV